MVSPDLTESDSSGPVTMRFLDTSGGGGRFAGGLGGQLLPRCLSTSRFTGSLLGTSHGDKLGFQRNERRVLVNGNFKKKTASSFYMVSGSMPASDWWKKSQKRHLGSVSPNFPNEKIHFPPITLNFRFLLFCFVFRCFGFLYELFCFAF